MTLNEISSASGSVVAPLIRVERLSRVITLPAQRLAILEDVSFVVPTGALFAVTGPSGSGKTTLLHLLTGIDRPTGGRILFAGDELCLMSEDQAARWRGRHVGVVFQFFQLLPTLTAQENVELALQLGRVFPRRQWGDRAHDCLALVGMRDYATRLPSELSGGEQQRVAIARALANDPPLLVADEPTGNLDSHNAQQVFALLASLTRRGVTVIYVTHDPQLAARATQRIALLDGRLTTRLDDGTSTPSANARETP